MNEHHPVDARPFFIERGSRTSVDIEGLTIPRSARGARREYGLAAKRCISVQFLATSKGQICRQFPFFAAAYRLSNLTFNPKVAGSIPARPIQNACSRPILGSVVPRTPREGTSGVRSSAWDIALRPEKHPARVGTAYAHDGFLQVDVAPAEGHDLAHPHAGLEQEGTKGRSPRRAPRSAGFKRRLPVFDQWSVGAMPARVSIRRRSTII
jgi:hypothetical protein